MSASREQGPRLRRLTYEPTPTEPTTECPPCGAQIEPTPASLAGGNGLVGPEVPLVTVPDPDAVRNVVAGVVRVLVEALDGSPRRPSG